MPEQTKKSDAIVSIYYYGTPITIHELSTETIALWLGSHTIMFDGVRSLMELMRAIRTFMEGRNDTV